MRKKKSYEGEPWAKPKKKRVRGAIQGIFSPIIEAQKQERASIKRVKHAKATNHTIDWEVKELAQRYQISEQDARVYILHERKKKQQKEALKKAGEETKKGLVKLAKQLDKYTKEYAEREHKFGK